MTSNAPYSVSALLQHWTVLGGLEPCIEQQSWSMISCLNPGSLGLVGLALNEMRCLRNSVTDELASFQIATQCVTLADCVPTII